MSSVAPYIVYEKRLVAFLDVMGFKEMLKGNSQEKLQEYYNALFEYVEGKEQTYRLTANEDGFKKLLVSDAVILSIKLDGSERQKLKKASRFISSVSLIQYLLAVNVDIWTRGAISYGNLFIDEISNTLVGPAFVSAYELEKTANYPRVIVNPQVCSAFDDIASPLDFVNKVNSQGYGNCLLTPVPQDRLARTHFPNDAIQVDWFKHAFDKSHSLEKIFAQLLLRYIRESYDYEKERNDDGLSKNRLEQVDLKLKAMGF